MQVRNKKKDVSGLFIILCLINSLRITVCKLQEKATAVSRNKDESTITIHKDKTIIHLYIYIYMLHPFIYICFSEIIPQTILDCVLLVTGFVCFSLCATLLLQWARFSENFHTDVWLLNTLYLYSSVFRLICLFVFFGGGSLASFNKWLGVSHVFTLGNVSPLSGNYINMILMNWFTF